MVGVGDLPPAYTLILVPHNLGRKNVGNAGRTDGRTDGYLPPGGTWWIVLHFPELPPETADPHTAVRRFPLVKPAQCQFSDSDLMPPPETKFF